MTSFSRQRVILLTLLYCFAAAVVSGVLSTRVSESFQVSPCSEIGRAGVRSLTSTEEMEVKDETRIDKEEFELQSSLPRLYHTPEVMALNYREMSENLKVFVYPNSPNASYEYDVSSKEREERKESLGSDVQFLDLLMKDVKNFVTKDPEEAHLFFLPVSLDATVSKLGPGGVGHHLRHYLQVIRENFTFWDRSLGSDHFYLATVGYEPFNHRNNLEFTKNAIQVARSPLQPQQFFYPHKDIALPSYQSESLASQGPTAIKQRSHLAYFGLQSLTKLPEWSSDAEFVFDAAALPDAKVCVTDSVRNVVDALRAGCVPVLVSDTLYYDLPFQDILQWHSFAVVMGASEMGRVKEVMQSMPADEYKQMQYLGMQASLHLQWNDPPAAYDAFHMTMLQLWMRRHSVKYARRAES